MVVLSMTWHFPWLEIIVYAQIVVIVAIPAKLCVLSRFYNQKGLRIYIDPSANGGEHSFRFPLRFLLRDFHIP